MIKIEPHNSVYIKVHGDAGVERELFDTFRFRVPGYVYMKAYKAGFWDGYINLYDRKKHLIYAGLYNKVTEYLDNSEAEYESSVTNELTNFSVHEAKQFIELLKLPYEVRDYQIDAFVKSVRELRRINVMPTGSGKSLVIYALARYFNFKTLIVVPTINLVHQLADDFNEYGYKKDVHKIFAGEDKFTEHQITISTWQSIHELDIEFFNQFDVVIVDECHLAKAKSITTVMEKLVKCPVRLGFTGTLDGAISNEMVLEGLFGPIYKTITSAELIEQKHLSPFEIKAIIFKYPEEQCKAVKDFTYQEEINWIVSHPKRNETIKNLALSLQKNTLILFQFVEKHGKVLYDMIKESTDRPVYFIHGKVSGEDREAIRKIVSKSTNAIIIGSNQTVSTGINIPTLNNIIFTSPTKSRIRTLQSIGRVLRTSENKDKAILFDLADDLQYKRNRNFTINHFIQRVQIYKAEEFPFKSYNIKL